MRTSNIVTATALCLLLAFLMIESYRTAPAETGRRGDGPVIHWGSY